MSNTTPVALITGAGKKRIGWHIAQALAERGYRLAIHYRTSRSEAEENVHELQKRGLEAIVLRADLRVEIEVSQLVQAVLKNFGQIDVLVNAAAIWKRRKLEEITAADVREHFETNTLGTFLTCQHGGLAMAAQPSGGTIINIGDWAEVRPYLDYAAYFPSKGAVTTLTRSMAIELGTRNPKVRVNAILPGPVMLPPDLPAAERAETINATLVKREGSPRNIVLAALHFIDNDFVTGTCLPVDGGRTIFAG